MICTSGTLLIAAGHKLLATTSYYDELQATSRGRATIGGPAQALALRKQARPNTPRRFAILEDLLKSALQKMKS